MESAEQQLFPFHKLFPSRKPADYLATHEIVYCEGQSWLAAPAIPKISQLTLKAAAFLKLAIAD